MNTEVTVKDKLTGLYQLQLIDSKIDEIKRLRGELPLKVQDLEDEVTGLKTREDNFNKEIDSLSTQIKEKKEQIKSSKELIKKYTKQQKDVRNNRQFDSLTKELEFQELDIQLSDKRIKEYNVLLKGKKAEIEDVSKEVTEKEEELDRSKAELDQIVTETKKEEDVLQAKSEDVEKIVENRLLTAYKRIRGAMRNGLAVVSVSREACGGCFNKLPPQRQLDVASNKKIIVCEFCGRILIDESLKEEIGNE